jgi:glycosyltransferase involved in cell wall biosynthesis
VSKRALVVSSIVPGTNGGAPVVTLGLLQALRGLDYDLAFVLDERGSLPTDAMNGLALNAMPEGRKSGGLRTLPRNLARLLTEGFTPKWNPSVWQAIQRELSDRNPELVVLDTLRVVEYGRLLREVGFRGRILLHEHNVEYGLKERELALEQRLGKRIELAYRVRKLKRIESSLEKYVDAALALTTVDQEWLSRLNRALPVHFVPPAMDLQHYRTKQPVPSSKELLFIGSYRWPPNLDGIEWFTKEVWPRVLAEEPEARLNAIGKHPPEWLKGVRGVNVTGFVDDERPYYERSRAAIAPLRFGSGVRVKILQSLAMARPMVSTTVGAEGIPIRDGESILMADEAELFAKQVLRVLRDDALARSLAENGRAVCEEWYAPTAVQRRLAEAIDGALATA